MADIHKQMIGKETFGLTKKGYSEKLSRIINNHRVNSKLIGESREFILRSCRLCPTWSKLAGDLEVSVFLRNLSTAGGRKVKMIFLERGVTKQPVPKAKLIDSLFPPKKIKTSASEEEKHYNRVKAAMRFGIVGQLKDFREAVKLPTVCYLTGRVLRKGQKTDVDHVGASFSELADNFLQRQNLKYSEIVLIGPPSAKKFKDADLWVSWQSYHAENAKLSLVCASANRSKGAGDYETPEHLYGSFAKQDPEDIALDF